MNKNMTLLVVSMALFMESVDTTVLNTAIPVMAESFNTNPLNLKLALISYLLSLAIFIPISGWIADKFGIKKVFMSAIIVFTLSSVWCGFTNNITTLVLARIVQGLGGSLTMPVGRLIILRTCERHELIAKMNIVVMVAAIGMMLGPLLGGLISEHISWRWIFWVNLPVGIFALLLAQKYLPEIPSMPVPPLDKKGFVLFGSGLACLTYGLSTVSETDIGIAESLAIILIAILLLALYAQHSKRQEHPIVAVNLFTIRTFRVSIIANLLTRLGFGGIPFLLPLLFQIILGYSPWVSGLLLTPIAAGVLLVKPLTVYILRFAGYKLLLITNTLLVSLSLCSFIWVDQFTPLYCIAVLTFIYGFLIALQYTGMNSLAYANIVDQRFSAATSIMSTIQQLAQSFGVAASAILIQLFTYPHVSHVTLTLHTFHLTFFALAVLTALSGTIFLQLTKEDGNELLHGLRATEPQS